jgi:hypothetical protein
MPALVCSVRATENPLRAAPDVVADLHHVQD